MTLNIFWNTYLGPILIILGISLQIAFFFKPSMPFKYPILGALCISLLAYVDKDILLYLQQLGLITIQYFLKEKK